MMRKPFMMVLVLVLAIASPAIAAEDAARPRPLRVLYVGNTNTDRGHSYARFLGERFTLVRAADRKTFEPGTVGDVDVVVLDWSQGDIDHRNDAGTKASAWESNLKSPLGER